MREPAFDLDGSLPGGAASPGSARTSTSLGRAAAAGESAGVEEPAGRDLEVIDVAAVARLLRVGRNTVYALVGRNEIPHRRVGKQIRFHRSAVMRWLASWSLQVAKERQ
jgi:excisionase family DNA binding protein